MIIGVSGVAGAGKDLFVQTCINQLKQQGKTAGSLAIASSLKNEVREWCLDHYGVDSLGSDREEKEKIRSFLVFHGTMKRRSSNGRHWIKLANAVVDSIRSNNTYDYLFISDVRYNDYPNDEVHWIKEELGGTLVHVSQYEWGEVLDKKNWPKTKIDKVFLPPANEEEKRNDPKVERASDYKLRWEKVENINKDKYITSEVVKFIEWIIPSIDEKV